MTQSPSSGDKPQGRTPRKPRAGKKTDAEAPRVNGPRALADLMPSVGGAAFRKFGFVQSSIVTRWAEIAGPRHAALSCPESIRFPPGKKAEGTLHLVVASGHAPILQHVLPDLIARVNRFFGYPAVARITLRQGEVGTRAAPAPPVPRPAPQPVSPALGEGIREIGDPELRAVLEAMASGLGNTVGRPPRIS